MLIANTLACLLTLVLLLVIFWQGSLIYAQILGAPSVNSDSQAIEAAFRLAKLKKGELVIDLGCGSARALIIAAKKFGAMGIGVERSPFYYLLAKIKIILAGCSNNITIRFGDFRSVEKQLQKADVVYLYLLNSVLANIEDWLFVNIKNDARVVSLAFSFDKHKEVGSISVENLGNQTKIKLYSVQPASKPISV